MKKMRLGNYLLYSFIGTTVVTFGGCSNSESTGHKRVLNVGHFVSVFKKEVKYKCDNKVVPLSKNNEFECQSFPIAFYSDNVKLGEIDSIHEDGYVFPQDIIVAEKSSAIYSSDDTMMMVSLPQ